MPFSSPFPVMNTALESQSNINSNTYIRSGLNSQIDTDTSKWVLTSGTAYLFNESDRDSEAVEFRVDSDLVFDFPLPLVSESQVWTYVDLNLSINYTIEQPQSYLLKDRLYLNTIKSDDGVSISKVIPLVIEGNNYTKTLLDKGGSSNINLTLKSGVGVSLATDGGKILIAGSNFYNDVGNPHTIEVPISNQIIWDEYDPNGGLIGAGITNLDFGRYWNGTSITTFTGNDATCKFFYVDADQKFSCIVGSNRYSSLNVIAQRWESFESVLKFFDKSLVAILLGRADALTTDSDRVIILDQNYG